jgi:hypothetical protein
MYATKVVLQLHRITAKHLAVTAQTLGAILALLPALRAGLIMRLQPPLSHALGAGLSETQSDLALHGALD